MKLAEIEQNYSQPQLNPFYISFSDLLLLLCVFFVMLIGMSKVEIGSFEKLRSGFTGSDEGTLVELAKRLESINTAYPDVIVRMAEDGVRLDLE